MQNDGNAEAIMLTRFSLLITSSSVGWDTAMLPQVARGFPFNAGKCRERISPQVTTALFHILSNSSLFNHSTIRPYIVYIDSAAENTP